MSRNKDLSESSSLRTKKKDSVEREVIDIPVLDGKTTEEQNVDDKATDFIHRNRSRLDHENEQDLPILHGNTTKEQNVDDKATDLIHRIRSRLNHENEQDLPIQDGNTTEEKSVDDKAKDFIKRNRSRLDHENKLELHDNVGNSNPKVSNMKQGMLRADNLKAKDPKGKNSRSLGTSKISKGTTKDDLNDEAGLKPKFEGQGKKSLKSRKT